MGRYGKYQLKIVAVLCLIVLLPISLLAAINFKMSLDNARDETERYSNQLLGQAMNEHALVHDHMKNIMYDMLGNMDSYFAVMDEYYTNAQTLGFLKEMDQRIGIQYRYVQSIYILDVTNRKAYSTFDNRLMPFEQFYDQSFLRELKPRGEDVGIRYMTRNIFKEHERQLGAAAESVRENIAKQDAEISTYYLYAGMPDVRMGLIAVNVRHDFLKAWERELQEKTSGRLYIADFRNEPVFRPEDDASLREGLLEKYGESPGWPEELELGGIRYLNMSAVNPTNHFRYSLLIPQESFANRVYRQSAAFIVIGALAALASAVGVFAASRYLYRPFSRIVQLVGQKLRPGHTRHGRSSYLLDESNFIRQAIDEVAGERQWLNEVVRNHRDTIKQRLLDRLTEGRLQEAADDLVRFGLRFEHPHFAVVSLHFLTKGHHARTEGIDAELIRYAICNIAEETLRETGDAHAFLKDRDTIVVLFNSPDVLPDEQLVELCSLMQHNVRSFLKVQLDCGIGAYRTGMEGIWQSYRESVQCLTYNKLMDWGKITHYNELAAAHGHDGPTKDLSVAWIDYEPEYIRCVKQADREQLRELFARIRKEARFNRMTPTGIQIFALHFAACLIRLCEEFRFPGAALPDGQFPVAKLSKGQRLPEVLEYAEAASEQLVSFLERKRANMNQELLAKAVELIRSDLNVTVESVAESVSLSPPSLNKLFREFAGMSAGEFILSARMDKAKELLKASGSKIEEIAEQVGYTTARGFYKVFKEATGLTPSEYRKLNL